LIRIRVKNLLQVLEFIARHRIRSDFFSGSLSGRRHQSSHSRDGRFDYVCEIDPMAQYCQGGHWALGGESDVRESVVVAIAIHLAFESQNSSTP
jgi:hypothetical protein